MPGVEGDNVRGGGGHLVFYAALELSNRDLTELQYNRRGIFVGGRRRADTDR
jgi:hypothetical protein